MRRRCCCGPKGGNTTIKVVNCSPPSVNGPWVGMPGVGVEVKLSGVTLYVGTTNAAGEVSINLPTAGVSYSVTITTANPRYQSPRTLSFTPSSFPATYRAGFLAASGYLCTLYGTDPVRDSLTISLADGDYVAPMLNTGLGGTNYRFLGKTHSTVSPVVTGIWPNHVCGASSTIQLAITVYLKSDWDVDIVLSWREANPAYCPGWQYVDSVGGSPFASLSTTVSASPLYASGTLVLNGSNLGIPVGGLSLVLTETP